MKVFLCSLFSIVLFSANAQNPISVKQTFSEYLQSTNKDIMGTTKSMVAFSTKQETEGSAFLLKDWAKGTIVLKNNTTLLESNNVLNFDKTRNLLILKTTGQNVIEIDMNPIARFQLQNESGTYSLVAIPQLGSGYLIELYQDSLYSLYKTLNTQFYPSNYVNKGMYETGYKYDRYVDENKYYIRAKDGRVFPVSNNKKELKKLAENLPALNDYLKANELSSTHLESSLINLTAYLNHK